MSAPELAGAREALLAQLREHALVIGDVTLSSGQPASYYVDARRALLRPQGFLAAGQLIAAAAREAGADAVGGPVMAAIPLACAAIAVPNGNGLVGFFVRKERKEHGLQRWVEGPVEPGMSCLVVEVSCVGLSSYSKRLFVPFVLSTSGLSLLWIPHEGLLDAAAPDISVPHPSRLSIHHVPDRLWRRRW